MEEKNSGLRLPTLLWIIFLILKLTGTVNWSWIWVFSPIWISWIISGFILLKIWIDDHTDWF